MKSVLAFGAGMLVGAMLALAGLLSVVPDHPVRLAADRALSESVAALRAAPGRIAAAPNVHAPRPAGLRRHVERRLRMARTGVVLAHYILPEEAAAVPAPQGRAADRPGPVAHQVAVPGDGRPDPVVTSPQQREDGRPAEAVGVGPERVYARALKAYEAGRHEEARRLFAAFLKDYPGHPLVPNALYWTGETWYDQGRYDKAGQAFARVPQEHPRHAKSPDALLKMAYSAMRLGRTAEARAWLDQLEARYPDSGASRLGRQARGRLQGRSGGSTMVANHG